MDDLGASVIWCHPTRHALQLKHKSCDRSCQESQDVLHASAQPPNAGESSICLTNTSWGNSRGSRTAPSRVLEYQ
eukprot:3237509-Amphidinium_carterae.2